MARLLPAYDELEIRLTRGREGAFNVDVLAASGARGHGEFAAPSELELKTFRFTVDPRNRRVRGRSMYLEAATKFGSRLFEALMGNTSVREVYTTARRDARIAGRGLRLTLSLRATPELAGIPWEFLYDSPRFLAQHVNSPVVRFVDLEDPPPPLHIQPPLRVLGMISHPKDDELAALDVKEEQAALERHLASLMDAGTVTVHWLERATLQALQQEVDHGEEFHVFHYIGHGEYDEDSGHSSLILEHEDRRPRRVGGQQLGALLCERGSLRLAVLNACEAAQTAPQDPLAGVATSLLEYEVPAVVAMQFAITDAGALTFADEFYGALAAGYGVDAAVTQARRALAAHSDVEWGTPVLFMRVADGSLFDLRPPAAKLHTPRAAASGPTPAPQSDVVEHRDDPSTAPIPKARSRSATKATTRIKKPTAAQQHPKVEPQRQRARRSVDWSSGARQVQEINRPRSRALRQFMALKGLAGVAFSPGGRRIATASHDRTARVWDVDSGRELTRVTHDNWVNGVAFSPDGQRIATASHDCTARVWDVDGARELTRVTHDDQVNGVAFSPDGQRIATASHDCTARVWHVAGAVELSCVTHDNWVNGVAFSPDGQRMATASHDCTARVWHVDDGRELSRVTEGHWVNAVAFSPDGRRIATATLGDARVWAVKSGRKLSFVTHDSGTIHGVAFSPDGLLIATCGYDCTARVWDVDSARELARLSHGHWVNGVAFSPDGQRIATALADRTACVWEIVDKAARPALRE